MGPKRAAEAIKLTDLRQMQGALEALLFVTDQPLSAKKLGELLGAEPDVIQAVLVNLAEHLRVESRGLQLREVGGGWRLLTNPAFAPYVERFIIAADYRRLTRAALETLAIIAYEQPVTKAEIGGIRGVSAEATVNSLVSKGLVREAGRAESPGQPVLYATTTRFMEALGLRNLSELPVISDFEADAEAKESIANKLISERTDADGGLAPNQEPS